MKGTRNPLRFPCLPLDDLDVMIFLLGFKVTVELSDQCVFKDEEYQWLVNIII